MFSLLWRVVRTVLVEQLALDLVALRQARTIRKLRHRIEELERKET